MAVIINKTKQGRVGMRLQILGGVSSIALIINKTNRIMSPIDQERQQQRIDLFCCGNIGQET